MYPKLFLLLHNLDNFVVILHCLYQMDNFSGRSPSPSFVYTGSGARLPSASSRGSRGRPRSGHVYFQEESTDITDSRFVYKLKAVY